MFPRARYLTLCLALACVAPSSQAAFAQSGAVSEARVIAAKRHVQTVCQGLEARRAYGKAARCYENVTAFLKDPTVKLAEPVRSQIVQQPDTPSAPIVLATSQRSSSLLSSNYPLSGVGF